MSSKSESSKTIEAQQVRIKRLEQRLSGKEKSFGFFFYLYL